MSIQVSRNRQGMGTSAPQKWTFQPLGTDRSISKPITVPSPPPLSCFVVLKCKVYQVQSLLTCKRHASSRGTPSTALRQHTKSPPNNPFFRQPRHCIHKTSRPSFRQMKGHLSSLMIFAQTTSGAGRALASQGHLSI